MFDYFDLRLYRGLIEIEVSFQTPLQQSEKYITIFLVDDYMEHFCESRVLRKERLPTPTVQLSLSSSHHKHSRNRNRKSPSSSSSSSFFSTPSDSCGRVDPPPSLSDGPVLKMLRVALGKSASQLQRQRMPMPRRYARLGLRRSRKKTWSIPKCMRQEQTGSSIHSISWQ